ncbi:hypothetical protein HanHA300_Chr16g0597191 [Helianthus annuus]|nr:hypothetical protein HanHA300_Chr16g0597191 [Helianthus annuus]KAJ0441341.1 hypothetical protein HanIR_Chr16g0796631 [Helianthus annuus]KAJ0459323.1 hypothetical protein HanHA89_Chr16g0647661 [Helianthus annuus]
MMEKNAKKTVKVFTFLNVDKLNLRKANVENIGNNYKRRKKLKENMFGSYKPSQKELQIKLSKFCMVPTYIKLTTIFVYVVCIITTIQATFSNLYNFCPWHS